MSSANGGRTAAMSDLVRGTGSGGGDGARTRIFLVRQPARSVRPEDAPNPLPVRLAIGVIVGVGTIILSWLIGVIGIRLGFAPLIHLPGIDVSLTEGLATTVLIVMAVPATIIRTGIEHPLLMMLCYALIALPGGCLAGVRSSTPGGPKPHPLSTVFAYTVAVTSAVQACLLVWWVVSPFRSGLIAPLPFQATEVAAWLTSMRVVAGLDVLAVTIAALWVVLIMRVAIPLWLRSLCVPAAFVALAFVTVSMSITAATVAQAQTPRTMIEDSGGSAQLMIGAFAAQYAVMSRSGDEIVIELQSSPPSSRVVGRQSIVEFAGKK
jgi:hypothetical protein